MSALKFQYEQPCSRCGGSAIDPDDEDCVCDCCVDGIETIGPMTEEEATHYPAARKIEKAAR